MRKIQLHLHPKQSEVFLNSSRHRVLVAGRKFGKTVLALAELLKSAKDHTHNVYIAPTYKMAKMTLWNDAILKFLPPELIKHKNETELKIQLFNGNFIELYGAEDPDRLRGANWDFAVLDEFQDFKRSSWEYVIEPNLLATKGRTLKLGTPKGFKNILYEEFKIVHPDWKSFHFTSFDNPFVDKMLLEKTRERLISEGKENVWKQEYLAQFTAVAGIIYDNFDRTVNVKEIEIKDGSFGFSVDRGMENPSGVAFFYIYTKEGDIRLHIFDEIYKAGLSANQLVQEIKLKMGSRHFTYQTADPSAKDFIATANELGLSIMPPTREGVGDQWVLDGIGKVKHWLSKSPIDGEPRLTISPNCVNLIEEIENYVWDENLTSEVGKDKPRKINDHLVDAVRYMICFLDKTVALTPEEQFDDFLNEIPENKLFTKDGFY